MLKRSTKRPDLLDEYAVLWGQCVPGEHAPGAPPRDLLSEIEDAIEVLRQGELRYRAVEAATGVPWWFTGILHLLEAGGNFNKHLHNGDPLAARTVQVPAGRPVKGAPPFTWTESAIDALDYHGWLADRVLRLPNGEPDWTLPTVLWRFENWNGWGYRFKGVRTPYLWAGSNLEQPGRYVSDGPTGWRADVWSKQIGAAVLLKVLLDRGLAKL